MNQFILSKNNLVFICLPDYTHNYNEQINRKTYLSYSEVRKDIFEYIKIYYDGKRKHASFNYKTILEIEKMAHT